jgi:4-hydroxy-4-methyl-2-oxoglutarate aldolase
MHMNRLADEVFRKIAATDSPTVSNAIEATHVRPLTEGFAGPAIRCFFPALGITMGYALTVQIDSTSPGPPAIGAGLRDMIELLVKAPKPAVLVHQDIGAKRGGASAFGEYIATLSQRLGVVALVTDGSVRDVAEVEALGFQYFAGGSTVSHGNPRLVRIGVPVVIDGLYVETGDIIHGDVNGILKVPFEIADQLPALIDEIKSGEKATFEFLKGSEFNYDEALRRAGH